MMWVSQSCPVCGFSGLDYIQAIETASLININIFNLIQHRLFICNPNFIFCKIAHGLSGPSPSLPLIALLEALGSFPVESLLLFAHPFIFLTHLPLNSQDEANHFY